MTKNLPFKSIKILEGVGTLNFEKDGGNVLQPRFLNVPLEDITGLWHLGLNINQNNLT